MIFKKNCVILFSSFIRGGISNERAIYNPLDDKTAKSLFSEFIDQNPIDDEDIRVASEEAYQEGLISEEEYHLILKELKEYLNQELSLEEVQELSKEDFEIYYQNRLDSIIHSFVRLSKKELDKLTIEELCNYRKRERLYLLASKAKLKGLTKKKVMHPFLYAALPIYHFFNHISVKVNGKIPKQKFGKKRPIILAVSHIGMYDTEVVLQAIKKHFYLLSDDEEFMYRTFDGWLFDNNGVVYVDNDDRLDKRVAMGTVLKYLKAKKNVLWCPEGIWNLDINKIILYLAYGIVEAADLGDALILPLGIEQFDKEKGAHFVVNLGDFIDVRNYFSPDMSEYEKRETKILVANILRDSMATLKFDAWGSMKRNEIESDYYDKFIQKRLAEWPYFNLDIIKKRTFKPSYITSNIEAFEHLEHVEIGSHNAFLVRVKKEYYHDLEEKGKTLLSI